MLSAQPMPPVQTGAGVSEVTVPVQVGPPPGSRNADAGGTDVNAGRPIEECFVIERTTAMRNAPRNTRGEICELRFLPLEDAERPDLLMEALIQHLLDRVLEGLPRPSLIGLQVHPPGFDRPYVIRLRPPEQNNAAKLAAAIGRLNEQSAAGIDLLAGKTITKVLAVWPLEAIRADPQSGGACDHAAEHHVSHKVQSLIRVINPDDRLCLALAVLLGLRDRETRMAGGGGRAALSAYASRQDQHGADAADLLTNAGIALNKHTYTLDDVRQLQQWLTNHHGVGQIRLVVFEKEQEYRIVFKGDGVRITTILGALSSCFKVHGYCIDCERRADARYHASGCKVACRLCLRFGAGYPCKSEQLPNGESSARRCNECGFVFPCDDCFNYHLVNQAPDPLDGRGLRQVVRYVNGADFAEIVAVLPILGFTSVHHLAKPMRERKTVVFVPDRTRMISHASYSHLALDMLALRESTTASTSTLLLKMMMTMTPMKMTTTNNHFVFASLMPKHHKTGHFSSTTTTRWPKNMAGISVHDGHGQRALGCVCMCGSVRGQQMRQWMSPPFANAPGDNTPSPPGAPLYNFRRLFFHSFDNAAADPVDQFLDYLTRHGPKNAHTVCIAHNGGKYDFHLVLEALHRRSMPPKRLCTTGLKIYSMKLGGNNQRRITFKDSVNFFVCQLDALVKSFNLPQHLATVKPFFPYMFINRQHLLERLAGLPGLDYYQPDTMKAEKRAKLLRWHAENNNNGNRFQLREQLIMYCTNNVAILRESVIRFRHLIEEHAQGLDPFIVASTAAGLALATLRRCFLPANHLVHSPEGGYLRGRRASAESQRYIRFFELEHPGRKCNARAGPSGRRTLKTRDTALMGFGTATRPFVLLPSSGWGCPTCFPERQQQLAAGRTAEDLYERTEQRLFELTNLHGCELHVVWSCQWMERLRHDPELKRRYDAVFVPCPLDPRNDALRGGRTEPFKLHHVCSDDEEILCIDIVSLYPHVMKANRFPVGNPRVVTREVLLHPPTAPLPWTSPENNSFRGLLLVRVLAPRNIRVPLLGYRTKDGRFTFPLCGWCADRRQQRPCRHGDDRRSWVTAYTHVELNKALQLGYVVTDLFEVWDYDEWDGTLFSSYVNTFVGLKVQATGWPEG
ncbi:hypothetical protein niasHT_032053 [Heterodera trifolii]|uniref:DNA-directed DNA polymerase n=1 Tax=Heterodera trifolii TaxID=157864 RepID=A0ABD2IE85_9BILA